MRADRLVGILLLLQQRGQVTAAEVAEELEVSERTARRDLEALGMAGLPVYSVRGRGGGWRLAGQGRTDLSGLTAEEAAALVFLTGQRGTTPTVAAALRKLTEALPEPLRSRAADAASSVVFDPAGWDFAGGRAEPEFLAPVQRALVAGEQVDLGYRRRDGRASIRRVHPLGVVTKGPHWYLLTGTDTGQRTFRVDRITSVEMTGQPAERPEDFDLAETWSEVVATVDELRTPVRARAVADPSALDMLRMVFGRRVAFGAAHGDCRCDGRPDGWVEVELRGHHVWSLAVEAAGFVDVLDVLEPEEVRVALAGIGHALARRYGDDVDAPPRHALAQEPPRTPDQPAAAPTTSR